MTQIKLAQFTNTLTALLGPELGFLTTKVLRELSNTLPEADDFYEWVGTVQEELEEVGYYELTDLPQERAEFVDLVYDESFEQFLHSIWVENGGNWESV